jgi:hypothetical protein
VVSVDCDSTVVTFASDSDFDDSSPFFISDLKAFIDWPTLRGKARCTEQQQNDDEESKNVPTG